MSLTKTSNYLPIYHQVIHVFLFEYMYGGVLLYNNTSPFKRNFLSYRTSLWKWWFSNDCLWRSLPCRRSPLRSRTPASPLILPRRDPAPFDPSGSSPKPHVWIRLQWRRGSETHSFIIFSAEIKQTEEGHCEKGSHKVMQDFSTVHVASHSLLKWPPLSPSFLSVALHQTHTHSHTFPPDLTNKWGCLYPLALNPPHTHTHTHTLWHTPFPADLLARTWLEQVVSPKCLNVVFAPVFYSPFLNMTSIPGQVLWPSGSSRDGPLKEWPHRPP